VSRKNQNKSTFQHCDFSFNEWFLPVSSLLKCEEVLPLWKKIWIWNDIFLVSLILYRRDDRLKEYYPRLWWWWYILSTFKNKKPFDEQVDTRLQTAFRRQRPKADRVALSRHWFQVQSDVSHSSNHRNFQNCPNDPVIYQESFFNNSRLRRMAFTIKMNLYFKFNEHQNV